MTRAQKRNALAKKLGIDPSGKSLKELERMAERGGIAPRQVEEARGRPCESGGSCEVHRFPRQASVGRDMITA